jgi:uncharacterized protein (TIGR04255 family)
MTYLRIQFSSLLVCAVRPRQSHSKSANMPAKRLAYSKAPILEAVIDFRTALADNFDTPTPELLDSLHGAFSKKFPKSVKLISSSVQVPFAQEATVSNKVAHYGYRFASEDDRNILLVSTEGVTFSVLAPYRNWEELERGAREVWKTYLEVVPCQHVSRAATRCINRIVVPKTLKNLTQYFTVRPLIPKELLPNIIGDFFMEIQLPQTDIDAHLVLRMAFKKASESDFFAFLDFDLFRKPTSNFWNPLSEELWKFLGTLHERRNKIFEASITQNLRETLLRVD